MFRGTFTALVTPFRADSSLDEDAVRRLIDFQLESGVDGLVLCGTTGEEASLSLDERSRLIELAQERVNGRVPIVVGAFSNVTARAVELARVSSKLDVDAILSVVPYYVRPNQQGLFEHFHRVADAVRLPIILSSVPARTGCALEPDTVARLAEHENIRGIDDSSEDLQLVSRLVAETPEGFGVYCGEDTLALPMLALGADGAFSLVSNLAPAMMEQLVAEALAGNFREARALHYRLFRLMGTSDLDRNPVPAKAALAMMGLLDEYYRLPFLPLPEERRPALREALRSLDLI